MMDLLGGSFEDSEAAEVKSMLQELKQEELLPTREVKVSFTMLSKRASNMHCRAECGAQLLAPCPFVTERNEAQPPHTELYYTAY
jgi:hypothetical protein